jgi:hypothetical protein
MSKAHKGKQYSLGSKHSSEAKLKKIEYWRSLSKKEKHDLTKHLNGHEYLKKAVKQIDPTTDQIVMIYSSMTEASIYGFSRKCISRCCYSMAKTSGGFKWEFVK